MQNVTTDKFPEVVRVTVKPVHLAKHDYLDSGFIAAAAAGSTAGTCATGETAHQIEL